MEVFLVSVSGIVYVCLFSFCKGDPSQRCQERGKMLTQISTAGVAYSKHIVHIYSYHGGDDLRNHLEVCPSINPFLI